MSDGIDIRKRLLGDLKRFARAEMARDLAKRHGKSMRLPWDPEEAAAAPAASGAGLDAEALSALSGVIGGD